MMKRDNMAAASGDLFSTVSRENYLGFWANHALDSRKVVDFLGLSKPDVAKIADVSVTSVRYDPKIPQEVMERLVEIANICELVAQYFAGSPQKTALWFKTRNALLGNIAPRDMLRYGRYERLRRFVTEALEQNTASPQRDGYAPQAQASAS
jgi:hypothetical protein